MSPLRIDFVSDVVCPWCVVGYLQLMRAIEEKGMQADIRWHPFELNPNMPPEGQDIAEHLSQKYGSSPADRESFRTRLKEIGDELGFAFNGPERIVNTFDAHRLLGWAAEKGAQTPLKLALFKAYFTDLRDVSDAGVLIDCAAAAGLPGDEAEAILQRDRYADDIRAEEDSWQTRGVMAVPFVAVNAKAASSGAQGVERYGMLIDKAL